MPTLHALRLFVATADTGSFSAAGRRHGVAPSSVSRQVASLEDGLGAQLLVRTTRHVSLTEAGRLYSQRIVSVLADLDEATAAVTDLEEAPRGVLRVNGPPAFAVRHIVPALPAFLGRYPEVQVDLTLTDNFVDLLEVGADVAVRVGELEDSSLIARQLAPNHRILCASPAYVAAAGAPGDPMGLRNHNCLVYTRHHGDVHWHLGGPEGACEVRVGGNFRTNNTEAVRAATLGGLGIALLPAWLVGDEVQSGRLVRILPDYRAAPGALDTAIHALYPANRHLSPKVRAFVDFLVTRFGPTPYWEATNGRLPPAGGDQSQGPDRHGPVG